jgi:hypothetical protein
MTSGPGTTGKTEVPPDEAIEEISGLLEMDDLNAGGSKTADSSGDPQAEAAHSAASDAHEHEVSLETPSPVKLESYLLPPPVADEPAGGQAPEAESASATNMAYEDLLEKLVLPTPSAAPEESEAAEEPPPFAPPRPSSSHAAVSPLANLFPPGAPSLADVSDERTVVTANPLLAEEQEAAAREAENFILPAAPVAPPVYVEPQVLAPPVAAPQRQPLAAPNKFIQISYPMFGFMMLAAVLVGGVLSRLMAPSRAVETALPAQVPTLVAKPVVPVQPTPAAQPANPAPQVVPLPTEPAAPAPVAAQPAAVPAAKAPVELPAAQPAPEEPFMGEGQPAARAKVHHTAKSPRPPKSAAPKVAAVKPAAPAKPAPAKKPAKGGWVDPFAQ